MIIIICRCIVREGWFETKTLYFTVQTAIDKSEYYARELEDSMLGIGTRNSKLIRLIVGRSERDLKYIKKTYEKIYGMSLVDRIDVSCVV